MLDLTCEIEREALWFSFAEVLHRDLDKFKEYYNTHMIRESKHAAVSGIPNIMYFLPEEFGKVDCLKNVSPQTRKWTTHIPHGKIISNML